jgi:hypothetical protein
MELTQGYRLIRLLRLVALTYIVISMNGVVYAATLYMGPSERYYQSTGGHGSHELR